MFRLLFAGSSAGTRSAMPDTSGNEEKRPVKRFVLGVAALAAICALASDSVVAQAPMPQPATPAAQPARPRIALVNIAKVLKEYNKANSDGQNITKKRQEYIDKVKPYSDKLAALSRQVQTTVNPTEKEKLQKEALAVNRAVEDLNQEAQRVLSEMTDHTIVEVYQNIKSVINDIAVTNNLDLVMCYPDGSSAEDDKKPVVAQMKLQSPALIPFYHRGMDITEVVVVTLNRRHPAPPVATTPPAPMGGNITPVGGKQ